MPLEPDPTRAAEVLARLDALRAAVADAEDDVLASLVVTGEPLAQRVLDEWIDQVADTLRALGEAADALASPLARFAPDAHAGPHPVSGPQPAADGSVTGSHATSGPSSAPAADGSVTGAEVVR